MVFGGMAEPGLMRTIGVRVRSNDLREFESHSLRFEKNN